ncbi:MAG: LacI family transcriptional regulator [Candidatus Cellulosilyticum pullistercoris]|uniref:LacI family transcriptional regulator n=1 Tax=Candidatus Cellulosilyticum pullistercoris TaxID=2838521 RepID=A0A9E2NL52_9FIRM|nr:LacI family transcriptional regulator [Candidatus Cellulosilyticum pullistercoris]
MSKVTIHDVATLAEVSPATVSRVLNGASVKEDLAKRTYDAIETLGYQVKSRKKHNAKENVFLIGVIVPDISSPFYSEIISGILKESFIYGYEVVIKSSESLQQREKECLEQLAKLPLNALIYYPIATIDPLYTMPFYEDIAIVIGGRENMNTPYAHVYFDNEKAGYLATKYLAKLGKKRIYYLGPIHQLEKPITSFEELLTLQDGPNKGFYVSLKRFEGYKKALEEENLPLDFNLVSLCGYTWQDGYDAARDIVTKMLDVDAIIAVNDVVATGILKFLKEQGIRVPEDISVIGYDNRSVAQISVPLLTTIDQNAYELGRECVINVMKQVTEKQIENKLLDVELIIRHSTAATNI